MNQPYIAIILVNYNSAPLLIECLESLYRLNYKNFQVIIAENSEQNQEKEIETIKKWSFNEYEFTPNQTFSFIFDSIIQKPKILVFEEEDRFRKINDRNSLVIIKSKENLGFANGCNKALDFVEAQEGFEYVWMLNTDTIVHKDALITLLEKFDNSNIIAVGSKLKYYDYPDKINLIGGKFMPDILKMGYIPIGYLELDEGQYDRDVDIDTPPMASCLTKLEFIKNIGRMNDDFFLYSEDVEWFERMKRAGYSFAYQYKSIVYHKESAITKTIRKSSLYYYIRNKIIFYNQYFPALKFKFGLFFSILRDLFGNIKRGYFKNIPVIFKGIIDGINLKTGKLKQNL